jgi:hypothetical protein
LLRTLFRRQPEAPLLLLSLLGDRLLPSLLMLLTLRCL